MKIVIIGGGIAGLSAGCYLRMNGYQTEILEANPIPGGLCTAWDRGPYVFDGCMQWLVGTHPDSMFFKFWNELGALAGREIVNDTDILRYEGANGQTLCLSANAGKFAADLKRFTPEDAARIDRLVRDACRCGPFDPPDKPPQLMKAAELARYVCRNLPIFFTIGKWMKRSLADYLASYRNPLLREALTATVGDTRMSALVLMLFLAWKFKRNAGYVTGGSRAFACAIADRYARLGGVLRSNTRVASVTVENDCATGVRCEDGSTLPADIVISCADGRATIFNMLQGRYVNKRIRKAYDTYEVFRGLFQASLGIRQTFPDAPSMLSMALSHPLRVDAATQHERMEVVIYGAGSGLCPGGTSIMIVRFTGSYDYWAGLRQDRPDEYAKAKRVLLGKIIAQLDSRFPGLASRVEQSDLATPATFARYTGNWQGSIQGWLPTPRILGRRFAQTLPGLKNFYMAGQWVQPGGGLPSAALSGRSLAQTICARDGKPFHTTTV